MPDCSIEKSPMIEVFALHSGLNEFANGGLATNGQRYLRQLSCRQTARTLLTFEGPIGLLTRAARKPRLIAAHQDWRTVQQSVQSHQSEKGP